MLASTIIPALIPRKEDLVFLTKIIFFEQKKISILIYLIKKVALYQIFS